MSTVIVGASDKDDRPIRRPALVYPGMGLLFISVIGCFTAWGIAADLTTPMVAGFRRIFQMSTFQASLVQLAYFGAYFLLALPAAFINQRFGYKTGLLTGLLLAALGSLAFYPASKIMTYEAFLVALFMIAAGCSILETSANPYVISIGPEETAMRRLNFAQAFNPLGTNIGVLLAATLILPKLQDPVNMASLTPQQLQIIRAGELGAVMGPYLGLGFGCLIFEQPFLWVVLGAAWGFALFGRFISMMSDNREKGGARRGGSIYGVIAAVIEFLLAAGPLLYAFGFVG